MTRFLSVTLLAALMVFGAPDPAAAQAPPAQVIGPVPPGAEPGDPSNDIINNMSAIDLEGYVEEEYFIEGTANRYTTEGMETGDIIDSGHPYRTRFIVRRPASPERFNGTVVVEWMNVTAGRDLDIDWFQSGAFLVREGYAWVGVSAQRVGVDYLRQWSPTRYGTLDVTVGGTIEGDALSYDIFAAITRALREPGDVDPMAGMRPEQVFATGHSQSAGRLVTYLNNIHPRDPIFDAVVVHGGGANVRDDQDVKVWKLMAETDMVGQVARRQPDTANFRFWEVAGTSHVDIFFSEESARVSALMAGRDPATAQPGSPNCDLPTHSRVPFRHVMNAAFDHLVHWVRDGTPPPSAPPIEVAEYGPPAQLARDEYGNVLGGIRLAGHAVPTATHGLNSGGQFCSLYGSHLPFDGETLAGLYPTHEDYLAAVRAVVAGNLEQGYILPHDAEATIEEAMRSGIGR